MAKFTSLGQTLTPLFWGPCQSHHEFLVATDPIMLLHAIAVIHVLTKQGSRG